MGAWPLALNLGVVGLILAALGRLALGTVPHIVVRIAVLLWPRSHPRRREILHEFPVVPAENQNSYVAGILVAGIVDGLGARLRFVRRDWTIANLMADLEPLAAKPPAKDDRRRLELIVRTLIAAGVCALLPAVFSHSRSFAVIMAAVVGAMFLPSALTAVLAIRDATVRLWQRWRLGRQYLVVLLMEDYCRHLGIEDDSRGGDR